MPAAATAFAAEGFFAGHCAGSASQVLLKRIDCKPRPGQTSESESESESISDSENLSCSQVHTYINTYSISSSQILFIKASTDSVSSRRRRRRRFVHWSIDDGRFARKNYVNVKQVWVSTCTTYMIFFFFLFLFRFLEGPGALCRSLVSHLRRFDDKPEWLDGCQCMQPELFPILRTGEPGGAGWPKTRSRFYRGKPIASGQSPI